VPVERRMNPLPRETREKAVLRLQRLARTGGGIGRAGSPTSYGENVHEQHRAEWVGGVGSSRSSCEQPKSNSKSQPGQKGSQLDRSEADSDNQPKARSKGTHSPSNRGSRSTKRSVVVFLRNSNVFCERRKTTDKCASTNVNPYVFRHAVLDTGFPHVLWESSLGVARAGQR
jgi:hypothetical protein